MQQLAQLGGLEPPLARIVFAGLHLGLERLVALEQHAHALALGGLRFLEAAEPGAEPRDLRLDLARARERVALLGEP